MEFMDKVKNTIFPFIVGLLIGAIVTSACFLVFNKTHAKEKIKEPTRQEQFKDDLLLRSGGRFHIHLLRIRAR